MDLKCPYYEGYFELGILVLAAESIPLNVCVLSCFSCIQLFATLWTVVCKAPPSMGFSRQEYWSGLPCPPPGGSSQPRDWSHISCVSCSGRRVFFFFLPLVPPGKSFHWIHYYRNLCSVTIKRKWQCQAGNPGLLVRVFAEHRSPATPPLARLILTQELAANRGHR